MTKRNSDSPKTSKQGGSDRPYQPPKPQHVGTVPSDAGKFDPNFGHRVKK